MNERCLNVNGRDYYRYGGRGIKLKFKSFQQFEKWALKNGYADNLSIDRVDNDGDYKKSNCRWTNKTFQLCNQQVRIDNTSGYRGIFIRHDRILKYEVDIKAYGKRLFRKCFANLDEAIATRNSYITKHNLPNTLTVR